jgi:RNA polymerase sigma-70 factor (ECF subfamily)
MEEREWLVDQFQAHRAHLRAATYRMLGSLDEADAVQEAWLRLFPSDTSTVENLGGWLTTVVSRVCLDSCALTGQAARLRWVPTCPTLS